MPSLSRLAALGRRFVSSIREEGLRMAVYKARVFLTMRLRGWAPSMLRDPGGAAQLTDPSHYLQGIWSDIARGNGFHVPRSLHNGPKIALIGDLNLAQCRKYRVEQLAELFEATGISCEYAHYQDYPRASRILQGATHLWEYRLQAMPITTMYRYEARRLGLPVLWDIDDPLFSISAYETYHNMDGLDVALKAHFLREAPKYAEMMNGADIVSVSTPILAEHARLYTRRPVFVRRNFADTKTLTDGETAMQGANRDETFRLVFASGSQGHEADFSVIGSEIAEFVAAAPNRRLTLLGHFDKTCLPDALAKRTDHYPFVPYERYLHVLANADLAVMPLCDDLFNRAKSAVRVIDAACVGVPSVVSPIGDQVHLIDEGETGFVARTSLDWKRTFETCAADRARVRKMGLIARSRLETNWAGHAKPHIIAPELLEWIRK